jgi:hypothetical protein
MKHQLALEIPNVTNPKILRIVDISNYIDALPVDCSRIEITVPGFISPVPVEVTKEFSINLDTCKLSLQATGCNNDTYPLPDGIYVIRYSVSPNDKVYVEYNHLRMTQTMNNYYLKIGTYDQICCGPLVNQKEKMRQFQLIKSFLDAAKGKVENRHEPYSGMELFQYAQRLLEKTHFCQ